MKIGHLVIKPQRIVIILGIGMLLFLIMDFNSRMSELTELNNQAATVRARATGVVVTRYTLETQVAYATSAAAAQEYARNEAHMIQPGDNVIVPVGIPGAIPPPSATPTPTFANLTNWDVWMEYLFGK